MADNNFVLPLGCSLDAAEREFILATLKHLGNRRKETAKVLGIAAVTLREKLDRYKYEGHDVPPSNSAAAVEKRKQTIASKSSKKQQFLAWFNRS